MSTILLSLALRDDHAERIIRDMELGERSVSSLAVTLRVNGLLTQAQDLEHLAASIAEDINSFKLVREMARTEWRAKKEAGSVPLHEVESSLPDGDDTTQPITVGEQKPGIMAAVMARKRCETCRGRGYFERAVDLGNARKPGLKAKEVCIKCGGEGTVDA